ncbi:VOC family protein [Altererythrobacter sp. KTW20L]|uniref:VOC family protein n=1 Tax=Altererythrobacter sp. KTW20L TaxID=2942210 RepID=UPI0020C143DB|nr:VOC family protein [Altererythrobacter sp. KTW20L]MCL6250595.1 VOC family protein [Altererythrobacter sp. KTW20L]
MADSSIRFSFVKLQVEDMGEALAFWQNAFGFTIRGTYDEPTFFEQILSLPGEDGGLSLMLVQPKPVGHLAAGTAHGPIGFQCSDIVTALENALAAGATKTMDITEVAPGVKVCLFVTPQGHEVELVQAG